MEILNFEQLLDKLKKEGVDLDSVKMDEIQDKGLKNFIRLVDKFNNVEDFKFSFIKEFGIEPELVVHNVKIDSQINPKDIQNLLDKLKKTLENSNTKDKKVFAEIKLAIYELNEMAKLDKDKSEFYKELLAFRNQSK